MTLVDTIIHSVWFPLITGIASLLGCVLALYPIQIHPLHPSEYRTLQWKKTLLIAASIGIIISSCIQIYLNVSPKYEWIKSPSADYAITHDNCSAILLAPQASCDFNVTFKPTTSFDGRFASIQINVSQIRSSTFSIILQGKGTVSKPHASLSIGQEVILADSPLFF
jgi:hypothetical protein